MKMTALPQSYQWVRELAAASVGAAHGVRTFPDEPNVAAFTFTVDATGNDQAPSQLGLDILHRSFGQLPVSDVAATIPAALLGGVLSHVAERLLMRAFGVSSETQPAEPASVGAVFDAAAAAGVPLHTVQGTLPADVTVPPDAAARLGAWLTKGWVAILPEHPVQVNGGDRTGWWLVDPGSGLAIDEMDDGRGAARGIRDHPDACSGGGRGDAAVQAGVRGRPASRLSAPRCSITPRVGVGSTLCCMARVAARPRASLCGEHHRGAVVDRPPSCC